MKFVYIKSINMIFMKISAKGSFSIVAQSVQTSYVIPILKFFHKIFNDKIKSSFVFKFWKIILLFFYFVVTPVVGYALSASYECNCMSSFNSTFCSVIYSCWSDIIVYQRFSAQKVEIGDEEYQVVQERDVISKVNQ